MRSFATFSTIKRNLRDLIQFVGNKSKEYVLIVLCEDDICFLVSLLELFVCFCCCVVFEVSTTLYALFSLTCFLFRAVFTSALSTAVEPKSNELPIKCCQKKMPSPSPSIQFTDQALRSEGYVLHWLKVSSPTDDTFIKLRNLLMTLRYRPCQVSSRLHLIDGGNYLQTFIVECLVCFSVTLYSHPFTN